MLDVSWDELVELAALPVDEEIVSEPPMPDVTVGPCSVPSEKPPPDCSVPAPDKKQPPPSAIAVPTAPATTR